LEVIERSVPVVFFIAGGLGSGDARSKRELAPRSLPS
jgi:hypothetical protein